MKFVVTGSGGCVCTPKPLCQCPVCREAREKGFPYARCGCSLYLEDIGLLFDTPEDISAALNHADIKEVNTIAYSHCDPDHTLGMRVIEQLRLEWLDYYDGVKPQNPLRIAASPDVMKDINAISSKYGSFFGYYQSMNLIAEQEIAGCFEQGGVKISFVKVPKEKAVTVFVIESDRKKLVYAPCDCLPFPDEPLLYDADVLILGNTFVGDTLKNGKQIAKDHPLREELYSFEDARSIREKIRAKRLVITHIEEAWGKSLDDYSALESRYPDVSFAYDGLTVTL
ncbi:MBL fold metallo-hydrolase [Caproiciproducens sp. NJN-50]|uniref:MBL fold metallo-hydrolase n=2 Tax=Acutalibacteraceae TaxID=3082771 RepID=UPI000FFE1946|nr:MBL fold metallo-hydrolase [Caproiciproducens sp. NJN-50]QAT48347.1 MBL fold metallo-hydrolase [Caproiciproducens sp. NJN-50]